MVEFKDKKILRHWWWFEKENKNDDVLLGFDEINNKIHQDIMFEIKKESKKYMNNLFAGVADAYFYDAPEISYFKEKKKTFNSVTTTVAKTDIRGRQG